MSERIRKDVSFGRFLGSWWNGFSPASGHRMKFPKGEGPFEVTVSLKEREAKKGYRIDEQDPLWVQADAGSCPTTKCSHPDIKDVTATATSVTFTNTNDTPGKLRYQVNVIDPEGRRDPIDPIMENGGRN